MSCFISGNCYYLLYKNLYLNTSNIVPESNTLEFLGTWIAVF